MSKELAKTKLVLPPAPARGFEEGVEKEDLIIPRAKLLQSNSPEVLDDGMKAGTIINSLTGELLPTTFIPLFKNTNWIRFNPRDKKSPHFLSEFAPGKMIWRRSDPTDPKVISEASFGPNGEVPAATKFLNFFSVFPGHPMPIIISFSKTSMKAGKKLLSTAALFGGDMFGRQYNLTSKQAENDSGKFYILDVALAGIIENKSDTFKASEGLYENYKDKPVEVHEEEIIDLNQTEGGAE